MGGQHKIPGYPVSYGTKKLLDSYGVRISYVSGPEQATVRRIEKQVMRTHDILEHIYFVKQYVKKRYDIHGTHLEFACWLFPKSLFTRQDVAEAPMASRMSFDILVKSGIVKVYSATKGHRKKVYELTPNAKSAVKAFNRYVLDFDAMPTLWGRTGKGHPSGNGRITQKFADKINAMVEKLKKG